MALDFPGSPTNGQEYSGYIYNSTTGAWQSKTGGQSPFYTGATAPTNPTSGDGWFNTSDGTMYVYYNDGTSSQWVEHRSQIAKNQVGLTPVVPTSVAVGSGSATIASSGEVSFTGTNSIMLNGIFTSSFRAYRIFAQFVGSADLGYAWRLNAGGTSNTNLYYHFSSIWSGGSGVATSVLNSQNLIGYSLGHKYGTVIGDIINPNVTASTKHFTFQYAGLNAATTGVENHTTSAVFRDTAYAADGCNFFSSTGTMAGTIKVYGYN